MKLGGGNLENTVCGEIVWRAVPAVVTVAHIALANCRITVSFHIKQVVLRDVIFVHALSENDYNGYKQYPKDPGCRAIRLHVHILGIIT